MRITFLLPEATLAGGVRVVSIYADQLQRRGHSVTVVSTTPKRPSLREIVRSLKRGDGWPAYTRRPRSYFDALEVPHRICPHSGPITDTDVPDADLVIATWWETAEWAWGLSPRKGVKVHFMQDYETWCNQVPRVDAACQLPMPKIVIAEWVRDLLRRQFRQEPVALVPDAVDACRFFAPPRGKRPVPTVGFNYNTMVSKGSDIAIMAYQLAKEELPSLRLISFGSTPPIASLPLPPETDFTLNAPDEQLRHIYARCDAWLYGTRREGFGLPILEAMACRTPVIGTPGGAAPELLARGGGMLVHHEDPAGMAEAIIKIAEMSETHWRGLSDRALATATSYTWTDATDRFEAALQAVLERPRAAVPAGTSRGPHNPPEDAKARESERAIPHRAGQIS